MLVRRLVKARFYGEGGPCVVTRGSHGDFCSRAACWFLLLVFPTMNSPNILVLIKAAMRFATADLAAQLEEVDCELKSALSGKVPTHRDCVLWTKARYLSRSAAPCTDPPLLLCGGSHSWLSDGVNTSKVQINA